MTFGSISMQQARNVSNLYNQNPTVQNQKAVIQAYNSMANDAVNAKDISKANLQDVIKNMQIIIDSNKTSENQSDLNESKILLSKLQEKLSSTEQDSVQNQPLSRDDISDLSFKSLSLSNETKESTSSNELLEKAKEADQRYQQTGSLKAQQEAISSYNDVAKSLLETDNSSKEDIKKVISKLEHIINTNKNENVQNEINESRMLLDKLRAKIAE